jgi:K+-sensing histidine kinase KdpD
MLNNTPSALIRYSVAVVAIGLVLLLKQLLWPPIQPSVSSLLLVAVMVSAWYGGLGPALLATGLADLASGFFFFAPSISRLTFDIESLVRFGVFTMAALIISSLTAARKRVEEALRCAHEELEMRVQMRTTELANVNDALRAEIAERTETEARLT